MTFSNQEKTGTGTIIRISKAIDPPWYYATFFVKCPDSSVIQATRTYDSKEEMPNGGDEVSLVFKNDFWQMAD